MADQGTFVVANEILKEVIKWGVPLVGGLVAVFFTPLIDHIKFRLARTEMRAKQFEEFASELSNFMFHAELHHEFYTHGWTKKEDIDPIISDYNAAITVLRKKEFVYLAWAKRFWKSSEWPLFDRVISDVKALDQAIHAFNNVAPTSDLIDAEHAALRTLKESALALLSKP